ncbi:transcription antitermination factor NusB [Chloroflexota bacterium]
MVGMRRRARALALQALYEVDSTGHSLEVVLAYILAHETLLEEDTTFVQELVSGVIDNREKIDQSIQNFATAWPMAQISLVDRNVLRIAVFELLIAEKVPVKVAINEAVELAKKFGSDNSSRFVNGVLGSVSSLVNK